MVRPAGGYLSKDDAELLVRELYAERISKKMIRAFAPDSPFRRLQSPTPNSRRPHYVPEKLEPIELPGVRFIPPNYLPTFQEWQFAQ